MRKNRLQLRNVKKVAIIGVGFMGASLALAIRERFASVTVFGYARSQKSFVRLKRLKIVDSVSKNLKDVVAGADIVVLATPVLVIVEYLRRISPFLKRGAVVIDLGSTKESIQKGAHTYLPKTAFFVGCHPLCGSHKKGVQNARKGLYENTACIITTPKGAASRFVRQFWQKLGVSLYYFNSTVHDSILSYVSHLPHLLSFSLTKLVPLRYFKLAPASFKELTRFSSSSAQIWTEILLSNQRNMILNIKKYIAILQMFEKCIRNNDRKKLLTIIKSINKKQHAS